MHSLKRLTFIIISSLILCILPEAGWAVPEFTGSLRLYEISQIRMD